MNAIVRKKPFIHAPIKQQTCKQFNSFVNMIKQGFSNG